MGISSFAYSRTQTDPNMQDVERTRRGKTRESPRANRTRPTPHVDFDNTGTALNVDGLWAKWVFSLLSFAPKKALTLGYFTFLKFMFTSFLPSWYYRQTLLFNSITAAESGFHYERVRVRILKNESAPHFDGSETFFHRKLGLRTEKFELFSELNPLLFDSLINLDRYNNYLDGWTD